jgi:hypothetical protein
VFSQLQTANCKLQTINCKLQTPNCKLQTANCKLQTANSKLQTTNCKLQTAKFDISSRDLCCQFLGQFMANDRNKAINLHLIPRDAKW